MPHHLSGRPVTAFRDPAVRAALVVAALLGGWSATSARAEGGSALPHLDWTRIGEVGLLLVAVAGATIGARLHTQGLERAWWLSGADRLVILARGAVRAVAVGEAVLATWIVATIVTIELRVGLPLFDDRSRPAIFLGVLARWAVAVALVAVLGLLVGQVAGDAARAALLLAVATLPFTTEARTVLPAPPGWLSVLSPPLAVRGALLAASETAIDRTADHLLGVLGGVATLAWFAGLTTLVLRRDLAVGPGAKVERRTARRAAAPAGNPEPAGHREHGEQAGPTPPPDRRARRLPHPAVGVTVGLVLAAVLGWVAPRALAPDVPWSLRPTWRTQVAHHRASTQRTDAWLHCVAAGQPCPGLADADLHVPAPTRAVIGRAVAIEVAPAQFQTAPDLIDAQLDLPDRRSGPVTVVGAAIRVQLRPDGHDGWVVVAVSPAQAIVR